MCMSCLYLLPRLSLLDIVSNIWLTLQALWRLVIQNVCWYRIPRWDSPPGLAQCSWKSAIDDSCSTNAEYFPWEWYEWWNSKVSFVWCTKLQFSFSVNDGVCDLWEVPLSAGLVSNFKLVTVGDFQLEGEKSNSTQFATSDQHSTLNIPICPSLSGVKGAK